MSTNAEAREVSGPLKVGLVMMPWLFAWFLLGSGYSMRARLWGFGWAAVLILIAILFRQAGNGTP